MRQIKTASWLGVVILIGLIISAVVFRAHKPRVMIVHSYNPEYLWTQEVNKGLHRVIDNWQNIAVSWYYMDTKRFSSPIMSEDSGLMARQAIKQLRPDVLIAIDDNAQKYVGKYFVDDPNMNIVFAGINSSADPYGYIGAKNVTGIFEYKQLDGVKEIIQQIESKKFNSKKNAINKEGNENEPAPRLLYILDPSSLLGERVVIDSYQWEPIDYIGSIEAKDLTMWKKIVMENSHLTDYIMVSNYRALPVSSIAHWFAAPDDVMSWTEANSPVPVIGINGFNVKDGAMLSIGTSGIEQGEVAANMAEQIITQKIPAKQIAMKANGRYVLYSDPAILKKRKINLPNLHESSSQLKVHYKD